MPTMRLFSLSLLATGSLSAAALMPVASFAQDQDTFIACTSQQELQQVIGSDGKFVPEDCRRISATVVRSDAEEFCVLDFGASKDPGFLDRLTRAAVPTQWWVSCTALQRRIAR